MWKQIHFSRRNYATLHLSDFKNPTNADAVSGKLTLSLKS
jgi:hypothetical protein